MINIAVLGVLCMSLFMLAADKQNEITIKQEPFGKVINVADIQQLVCLGNSEVIFRVPGQDFCLFDFTNNIVSPALENYCRSNAVMGDWHLSTDILKQRALLCKFHQKQAQIV